MANFNIDYLIIAGGGGGASASSGYAGGGAGGAGGYRTSYGTGNISGGNSPVESALNLTIGTPYTITVGDGGAGGPAASPINAAPPPGVKGDDSVFASITSEGGGYGVGQSQGTGGSGGSAGGGGGGSSPGSGGTGTSSQGSNGGTGTSNCASNACYLGGGGGGASQAGSSVQGGKGGDGLSSSITGSSVIRAGGGSGGSYGPIGWNDPIAGGAGGGGDAGVLANGLVGQPGTTNTGGGGGGATWYTNQNSKKGGDGGSGIVILRYATADANYTTTGSTPTEDTTTIPGQTILSFTTVGTGSITFTTPPPPPFSGTKVTTPVTDFNKPNTEEGLKIPSGTSSNQPTGVDGMVRNDTTQSSKGSASAITYYNGTDWRYFENQLSTSFNTVLYTGTGVQSHPITEVGFQPDLVWFKSRNDTYNHVLYDSLRGTDDILNSNNTIDSESNYNRFTSFDTDGFTLYGNNAGDLDKINRSNTDYVAWCFKAGGLINKSADFNGSNSYITPSSSSTLTGLTKAVSVWIKSDNFTSIGTWPFQQGNGQGIENYIRFYNGSDIQIRWGNQTLTSSGYSTGVWYHIVAQENANGLANFWINGVEIATSTLSPSSVTGDTNIGRRLNSSSYQYYFNGQMAQLRLFSSSLDSTQIAQLYNETVAENSVLNFPNGAGCVAAYPLGENANDLSNTYNGTQSNVTFGKPGYLTRNTEGTIESTVSANNDLGFSIVKWSGDGSSATIGHGLDTPPELTIKKNLDYSADWAVNTYDRGGHFMYLNKTNGESSSSQSVNSTTFTASGNTYNRNGTDLIAYCFASKENMSKVGSYTGSTGAVDVNTGFEPAFVMIKWTSGSIGYGGWAIYDNKRDATSPNSKLLQANTNSQELDNVSYSITMTSTGFTVGSTQNDAINYNGNEYIYYAIANTI